MKKLTLLMVLIASFACFSSTAQTTTYGEKHGHTLNLGLGIGYYGYAHSNMPVVHANFEFDVAKNFTLAPFASFYKYERYYNWGDKNHPKRDYYYRETVIPIGIKGTYYFDQFLGAGSNWDFYLAGSLGFVYRSYSWENGYEGDRYTHGSRLYLDAHIGTEYHFNKSLGMFLDLSSGVSTVGLAFHL